MKRFLIQILIFSVLTAAVFAMGEVLVRRVENPYSLKARYLATHADGIATLVLGHSQNYYGIDPAGLSDSTFNMAAVSQTLELDRDVLEHYAPAMQNLRHVIVPMTYTSLYDPPIEKTTEWWRATNYDIYYALHRHPLLSRYSAEVFHMPTYAGKLATYFGLRESKMRPDSLGHGTEFALSAKYAEWRNSGLNTARRHTEECDIGRVAANLKHLQAIDSICRSHGARFVLVTPPLWHGYRENIDTVLWQNTVKIMRQWCAAREVVWLDYSASPLFEDDDFYDADHLTSDRGAAKFTRMLGEDLRKHIY